MRWALRLTLHDKRLTLIKLALSAALVAVPEKKKNDFLIVLQNKSTQSVLEVLSVFIA